MSDSPSARLTIDAITASGVQLAIDDFGTGYSSLAYVTRFPAKWIKIDRSLVRDCGENARSLAVLRAIVNMARGLDMQVIAEGIETAEVLQILIREGCDVGQGYLLGRPMPVERLIDLAREDEVASATSLLDELAECGRRIGRNDDISKDALTPVLAGRL